jgi:2-oxoisovalerate ferredoxin oxidoreductase beta subunit
MRKEILQKPESFYKTFFRKPGANPESTHYCPGCGHGVIHKLIAEAMDDFGIQERTIMISPVGCAVFAYYYFDCGNVQAAHGRAPAVATGLKRALPNSIVISYQGDGDLAGIGGNNIIQAANRGEHITVIFVNNAIYGMTGAQMAPTTLIGQKTSTTPLGRMARNEGYPLRMCELLATLEAPVYIERVAIADAKSVMRARKAIRKAIQNQIEGKGFSLVEVLSPCPTGWRMTPSESKKWVMEVMSKYFQLGVYKDENGSPKNEEVSLQDVEKKDKFSTSEIMSIIGAQSNVTEQVFARPKVKDLYQNPRIKIAGFGGQGVLLLGLLLSESAMLSDYHSTWLPSYGPEMRGGTAHCHVNISDRPIGSPLVSEPDVLIAMNLPSLDKFEDDVKAGGLILVNSSLIKRRVKRKDIEAVYIPATEIADGLGMTKVANVVILGAYLGLTGLLSINSVLSVIKNKVKRPDLLEINREAILKGKDFILNKT